MKILFCGGREYREIDKIIPVLANLDCDHCVVGDANGVDAICAAYFHGKGIPVSRHIAKWRDYGTSAGPIRNSEMLKCHPDIKLVIAFSGGNGTANMTKQANASGIKIRTIDA